MEFAVRMRTLRVAQGLMQAELGALTGVSQRIISLIETGKLLPAPELEQRLREALQWDKAVENALDIISPEKKGETCRGAARHEM